MRIKWQPLLILGIALGTPLVATLLYLYAPPTGTTNRGELVEPVELPSELWPADDSRWQLAVIGAASCDEQCQQRLCATTQARLVNLGELERIGRLWLVVGGDELPEAIEYSPACGRKLAAARKGLAPINVLGDVSAVRVNENQLASLPVPAPGREVSDYIYLIDPSGLVMMRFAQDAAVAGIAKDLKRLLRLSKRIS